MDTIQIGNLNDELKTFGSEDGIYDFEANERIIIPNEISKEELKNVRAVRFIK